MKEVTDPELLAQLNGPFDAEGLEVTDPALLAQLNGEQESGFRQATDVFMRAHNLANPVNIARRAYEGAIGMIDKGGEMAAEGLAVRGVDPRISAAVGTGIQMIPDIVTAASPAGPEVKSVPFLEKSAEGWAQRALGIPKAQLRTPFARGQAAKAAKTALDEGVIPWSGSRQTMTERAKALADSSGAELGDIRTSVGPQPIDHVFDSLENLRKDVVGGRTGGIWDDINRKIDKAQESIMGLVGKDSRVSLADVEKTKNELRDTVNYMSDASSQKVTKQTTRAIERGVEKTLTEGGADLSRYKSAKEKFGAAKKMLEGLDVSAAAQAGNNRFGPIASGGGIISGALTGNPLIGALTLLGTETAKRRGPSVVARLLDASNVAVQKASRPSGPLMALIAELAARSQSGGR